MTTPIQADAPLEISTGRCRPGNPISIQSLNDDLHILAGLELIIGIEAVEDPEAIELAVDESHAPGKVLDGVAGLDLDDFEPQRLGRAYLGEREPAEGVDGLAESPLGVGRPDLGGE